MSYKAIKEESIEALEQAAKTHPSDSSAVLNDCVFAVAWQLHRMNELKEIELKWKGINTERFEVQLK